MRAGAGAVALLVLAGCATPEYPLTSKQLAAETPWDLGSEHVDTTRYPKGQQRNYDAFAERCSKCHTLARPINSPVRERQAWSAYLEKMHQRAGGVLLSPLLREQILEFLVFDGEKRKSTEVFARDTRKLEALYERVKRERGQR